MVKDTDRQKGIWDVDRTRPDSRPPQSPRGGQGPYLRSIDHLGKSSETAKIRSKAGYTVIQSRTVGQEQ